MNLFHEELDPGVNASPDLPLAERMRPAVLEDVIGQRELLADGAPLRTLIERGRYRAILFWGPPGRERRRWDGSLLSGRARISCISRRRCPV